VIEGYAGDYTMDLEEMYRSRCNTKECAGRKFANSCMNHGSIEGERKVSSTSANFVIVSILDSE
jgi:hypothetical protein